MPTVRLAAQGYRYGEAFQGLRAMWRRGDEIFAEVAVPQRRRRAGWRIRDDPVCWTPHCMRSVYLANKARRCCRFPGKACR